VIECARCDDSRFVCERHPDRPFFGDRACPCGDAGVACPDCNPSEVTVPEMPEGFQEDVSDESRHFIKCPECGGWFDCRDLGSVFDHHGPLPHPKTDQPQ
jgi:hypothetical protein